MVSMENVRGEVKIVGIPGLCNKMEKTQTFAGNINIIDIFVGGGW